MKFIVLGDLHFASYAQENENCARDNYFSHVFKTISLEKADFVFAIGDTTNEGTIEELKTLHQLANNNGIELFSIVGNHDSLTNPKTKISPFFLNGKKTKIHNLLCYTFDYSNIRFLILDTARDRNKENYSGIIEEEQLHWIDSVVKDFNNSNQVNRIIIMGHHPLKNTTARSAEWGLNIDNSNDLLTILKKIKTMDCPTLYLCGHNHEHSIYYEKDSNILNVQTANLLDCSGYRTVVIDDESYSFSNQTIDINLAKIKNDFESSRTKIPWGFKPRLFTEANGKNITDRDYKFLFNKDQLI